MYLHQKMIRIYADIVQNHTLQGVFLNFWRAVYINIFWLWLSFLNMNAFGGCFDRKKLCIQGMHVICSGITWESNP